MFRRPQGQASGPDARVLARYLLANIIDRAQRANPGATPEVLAEAILSNPDMGLGGGVVDTDELGGRHAAVMVWVPLRLSGPIDREVSP